MRKKTLFSNLLLKQKKNHENNHLMLTNTTNCKEMTKEERSLNDKLKSGCEA
jgi:hypothetical protein